MHKIITLLILLIFGSQAKGQVLTHLNISLISDSELSGFGFAVSERGFSQFDLGYEARLDIAEDNNNNTAANFLLGLGAYYNFDFDKNQTIIPYVGASGGLGFVFGDKSLGDYAPNQEVLQSNLDNKESPIAEDLFFYYNIEVGVEFLLLGRYGNSGSGLNISYNLGTYNRISAGFTVDFGVLDSIF
jgi:hypothetical protein